MSKVVAFMDEGRSHGNDLTAALLPAAAPPEDVAEQSPQHAPQPSQQEPSPPQPSPDRLPQWLPPPEMPQENGATLVASPGPSPHVSASFSSRSARWVLCSVVPCASYQEFAAYSCTPVFVAGSTQI